MSFSGNVKYRCEWTDWFDQSCKLDVAESGYAGSETSIVCARDPLQIDYEVPSNFLLDPIWGSAMIMNLLAESDFQFLDLYSNSNREYLALFYIDDSLEWKGYIQPDQYQEQYRSAPYVNSFIAVDQLGYLKTKVWALVGTMSHLDILEACLGATDLDLDMYEGVNLYEEHHNATAADSPLDQTWLDAEIYTDKTYYEVLKDVLTNYGAVIRQQDGKWFIFRPKEALSSFTRRLWTWSSGTYTYDSNETHNPVIATTAAPPTTAWASNVRIANGATMGTGAAWKKYKIIQDLGRKSNMLLNGDFTQWYGDQNKLKYWIPVGAIQASTRRVGDKLRLNSNSTQDYGRSWFQTVSIETDAMKLEIPYRVYVPAGETMTVRLQLSKFKTGTGVRYYDFDANGWTASASWYTKTFDNSGGSGAMITEEKIDIITGDSGTATATATVHLYTPEDTGSGHIVFDEVILRALHEVSSSVIEEFPEEKETEVELNADNNHEGDDINIYCSDYPYETYQYLKYIYRGLLYSNTTLTTKTNNWSSDGSPPYKTLIEILQESIALLLDSPQQIVSCSIYSKLLDSCSVVQDIDNSDTLFLLRRTSWHPKYGRWDTQMQEIGVGEPQPLVDEDGNALLDELGNPLYG